MMAGGWLWLSGCVSIIICPTTPAVLDVGCGKGFMLHDFKEIMPGCSVAGARCK